MKYLQTFRLHPTPEQADKIRRRFALAGYAYNWALQETERVWKAEQRHLSLFDIKEIYRRHSNFDLHRPCSREEAEAIVHLDHAYANFKQHRANQPRCKEPEDMNSCTVLATSAKPDYERGTVQLPIVGRVRCNFYRPLVGKPTTATIKEVRRGEFRIIYMADELNYQPADEMPEVVGIDLGVKTFATLSDGTKIDFPERIWGERATRHEQHLQRKMAKCKEDSRRWQRVKDKLARFHEHRANQRKDFHYQTAAMLTRQHRAIAVETLAIEDMMQEDGGKRHSLNRNLQHYGLHQFIQRLEARCLRTGTRLLKIGRYEPTSKTCSDCGYVLPKLDLKVREWTCPECGCVHDRDVNAAINIKTLGQQQLILPDDSGKVLAVERAVRSRSESAKVAVKVRKEKKPAPSSQGEKEHVISRLAVQEVAPRTCTPYEFLHTIHPVIDPVKASQLSGLTVVEINSVRQYDVSVQWRREMMVEKCERLRLALIEGLRQTFPPIENYLPLDYGKLLEAELTKWFIRKNICTDEPFLSGKPKRVNIVLWYIYIYRVIRNLEAITIKI